MNKNRSFNNFWFYNKNIVQDFVLKNYGRFVALIILIISVFIIFNFVNFYKTNKEKAYNYKLIDIFEIGNDINQLKKLYYEDSLKGINRTLTGISLGRAYKSINDFKNAEKVFKEVYNESKDKFFKDLAGLNLLNVIINANQDFEKITKLYNDLNNNKNNLLSLVKEQYGLYLLDLGKINEAKEIFNSISIDRHNETMANRIKEYKKIYKF